MLWNMFVGYFGKLMTSVAEQSVEKNLDYGAMSYRA